MRRWLSASTGDLTEFMANHGQAGYRARQFYDWLHAKRAESFQEMLNIPAALRNLLSETGVLRSLRQIDQKRAADNLTAKWLFAADAPDRAGADRNEETLIESVLIVEKEQRRRTVCVSSMAGCPLGCVFCATGTLGFVRNLESGEIIEQVYRIDKHCRDSDPEAGVSHIVFMGMGEPLLNLDAVLEAAAVFTNPKGLGLSGRHITISTAGTPEGIRRLAEAGANYRLAVSLHAPDQKLREQLMPAAKRWPLDQLFEALGDFAAQTSRDLTFEYCLIDAVNAAPAQARQLARLLHGFKAKVNLIPLNPVAGYSGKTPSPNTARTFRDILEQAGIPATIRVEKGREIEAACGQLKAKRLQQ